MTCIVPAEEKHLKQIVNLHHQVRSENPLIPQRQLEESEERDILRYSINDQGPHRAIYLGFHHNQLVGNLWMVRSQEIEEQHFASFGIAVLRDYKRQGIGRLLMQHGRTWAKEMGCLFLSASVISINHEARNFLQADDFEKETGLKNRFMIDATLYDEDIFSATL